MITNKLYNWVKESEYTCNDYFALFILALTMGPIFGFGLSGITFSAIDFASNIGPQFITILVIGIIAASVMAFTALFADIKNTYKLLLIILFFGLGGALVTSNLILLKWIGTSFYWPVALILLFVLTEVIFWETPTKPLGVGQNIWKVTAWRKLVAFYEALILLSAANVMRYLIQYYKITDEVILRWLGYAGVGLLILGVIALGVFVLLWLNSFKFRTKTETQPEEVIEEQKAQSETQPVTEVSNNDS